ncbi:MAG: hypothetical protein ABL930_09975, partial [Pseudobdellovibrio sp.]
FAQEVDTSDLRVAFDISATHSGLTTYKGYSDDFSAYLKFKYKDWFVQPFLKAGSSSYYYLDETISGNTSYSRNEKNGIGLGVDVYLNKYIRIRYVHDWYNNKTDKTYYQQDAYLLIYNQYLDLQAFELNNYLESVIVPRYSNNASTYLKMQGLKSYYINRDINYSNSIYPFAQLKLKNNDEEFFGKSGTLVSVGLGYKYYGKPQVQSSLAFVLEGHSVIHQSKDFNSDWFQILAVLQYTFK